MSSGRKLSPPTLKRKWMKGRKKKGAMFSEFHTLSVLYELVSTIEPVTKV